MRTGNYAVSCVMTDRIGVVIAVMATAMEDLVDTAPFVPLTPTDMEIGMEADITVLLASTYK